MRLGNKDGVFSLRLVPAQAKAWTVPVSVITFSEEKVALTLELVDLFDKITTSVALARLITYSNKSTIHWGVT